MVQAAGILDPTRAGSGAHNIVIGSFAEVGIVGSAFLALFIVPLVLRRGYGPDAVIVQAGLASLMVDALFLDVLSNRKQVWLLIGLAAGLIWLARRDRIAAAREPNSSPPAGTKQRARLARGPEFSPVDDGGRSL